MRKIYLLAVSFFVAVVFWYSTAMGYSVYPGIDEITVEPENYFEISYYFGGLGTDHGGLKAWYLDIVWDNSIIEIENPASDITFHDWDIPTVIDPLENHGQYSIGLTAFQMFNPSKTGEEIALATIRYHCLGPGQATIYPRPHFELLGTDFKGDITLDEFVLDEFVTFDVITEINQVPIPIPSTLLLLGTGLMGLVGLRRRKR